MHYKIYINIIFFVFFLVSCNNNKYKDLDISLTLAEKKEMRVQKKILINEMAKASIKLHNITWPILIKNAEKCKKNKNKLYGLLFADMNDLAKEDADIYKELFNNNVNSSYLKKYKVSGFPIILSVAKDSPAYDAGIEKNDIVLEIENNSTKNFRKQLMTYLKSEKHLTLKLLRNNKIIERKIFGVKGCFYSVQPMPSGSPNAFADGDKVFITLAAIKLARTKDELAFLIGHELAHNIYHYREFNASEADLQAINYLDKPKIRNIKSVFMWSNENREIEADIKGLSLAFDAGYSLENVNDYWRRLSVFNPELISKSINIYKSNAYRAALISKTLKKLKEKNSERR